MKVYLMYNDRDFDVKSEPCFSKDVLASDLELNRIIINMAQDDDIIYEACDAALFHPMKSVEDIKYRQRILNDAINNPDTVRQLYEITIETEKQRRSSWRWLASPYLSSTFSSSIELLKLYTEMLMKLRLIADSSITSFRSDGFRNLFSMLQMELSDEYFEEIHSHLKDLKDGDDILISSKMGNYLQGAGYVLRRKKRKGFWWHWHFAPSFTISERDDSGATDLGKRRDRAINEATNALAQAAEHLESFFARLRSELAFYVGCLNLYESLKVIKLPVCIPTLLPLNSKCRSWNELYDVSLALEKKRDIVGNELRADDKQLYIITGANQGGKSTFLRSIGQAQLMAQCGMFAGAEVFSAPVRCDIFSHFKKEEDTAMKSGKLDEELSRMSDIADHLECGALVLFNESFASTNEREGSEICSQITRALIENGIEIFSVTHIHTYAAAFLGDKETQYLRAQRLEGGERTFKIVPGEPLQTAFGEDLYKKIFKGDIK